MAVCIAVLVFAILAAILGPLVAPYDANAGSLSYANLGPTGGHLLGFDSQGRDLFSRLLVGARTSMVGPLLITGLGMLVGVALALAAAWAGGWVDSAISAVLDIFFAFPGILLAILAAAVLGAGMVAPAVALAVSYTPYIARVLRGAAMRERVREYVAASEIQGFPAWLICTKHLLPNIGQIVTAQATLMFGYAMVDYATVSFLGLGVQPPTPSWGVMVSDGQAGLLDGFPLESLSSGLCVVLVVLAVNLLGENLAARGEARA